MRIVRRDLQFHITNYYLMSSLNDNLPTTQHEDEVFKVAAS